MQTATIDENARKAPIPGSYTPSRAAVARKPA